MAVQEQHRQQQDSGAALVEARAVAVAIDVDVAVAVALLCSALLYSDHIMCHGFVLQFLQLCCQTMDYAWRRRALQDLLACEIRTRESALEPLESPFAKPIKSVKELRQSVAGACLVVVQTRCPAVETLWREKDNLLPCAGAGAHADAYGDAHADTHAYAGTHSHARTHSHAHAAAWMSQRHLAMASPPSPPPLPPRAPRWTSTRRWPSHSPSSPHVKRRTRLQVCCMTTARGLCVRRRPCRCLAVYDRVSQTPRRWIHSSCGIALSPASSQPRRHRLL